MTKTLIVNIGLLASPRGHQALAGEAQGQIEKIENAHVLLQNGRISQVETGRVPKSLLECARVID
ncbi:MAG: imidazolonepropionase, partial [Clostridiales bacterium]|nr:imidazolonepropionase [Clostridiales bacterium]